MCLVFVEYAIKPECRDEYLVWMERVRRLHPETEWYESEVQPGLFVELWRGQDAEGFERMKWLRTGEYSAPESLPDQDPEHWSALDDWVPGGSAKIRMWPFRKVK